MTTHESRDIDCEPCVIYKDGVWPGQYSCASHGVFYRDDDVHDACPVGKALAEVERLKKRVGTERIPELEWRASQHIAVCDVLNEPRGADIVGRVEAIKNEWAELRAHTWEQERAAVVAWLEHDIPAGVDVFDLFGRIKRGEHWTGKVK